jgi:hypothetical protein
MKQERRGEKRRNAQDKNGEDTTQGPHEKDVARPDEKKAKEVKEGKEGREDLF